jgi:hypothetical protein
MRIRDTVAIATMTLVRNEEEERRLGRSLAALAKYQMPIAVADAGASRRFTASLSGLAGVHTVVPHRAGLVAQVRASVDLAADFRRPYVLYTEPDKEFFFRNGLRNFLHQALTRPRADLAVASRSARSFETFPSMQRRLESIINSLCGEAIGACGDFTYGPFLMIRDFIPLLDELDADLGWGWRPFIFLAAHQRGAHVVHVTDEYCCPADQVVEEECDRKHRVRQFSENLLGLVAASASERSRLQPFL